MKYLVIAGLGILVLILVYRRLRPYIQLIQKFSQLANSIVSPPQEPRPKIPATGKLTRCASCGTWVPQVRALTLGSSFYCSTECIEKVTTTKHKAAS